MNYLNYIEKVLIYIKDLFNSSDPKYSLIIILLTMLVIYYLLGKVFAFIGFIVCMYYLYQYWKNRENINKIINDLFKTYQNYEN
jgi:hypothetical protein